MAVSALIAVSGELETVGDERALGASDTGSFLHLRRSSRVII
jgi:hypothetical protein